MHRQFSVRYLCILALTMAVAASPAMADTGTAAETAPPAAAAQAQPTLKGKILGISKKAKTISIDADGTTVLVKYNDATAGMEHAKVEEGAIISYAEEGKDKIATVIKPKLAQLPPGVTEITPDELSALLEGSAPDRYLLADARPAARFAEASIRTAISLPVAKMEKEGEQLLPADKDTPIVFFCGGPTCGLSTKNAGLAKKLGYTNVRVMLQGVPGWKKSGRPLVASPDFIKNGNNVIVDLRSAEEAAQGHIPRAVNIPFAKLAESESAFAVKPSAPIVVYGNGDEAEQGAKIIQKWGFKTVALVDGGIDGWKARGGELASGATGTEISWTRIPGKDEVVIADFLKAVEGGDPGRIILDVRTKDEAAAGGFAGAVHIPLDELANRMTELPSDREILVHCTTGARAEMGTKELVKAGYRSKFLLATVECDGNDCSVEE
ncbi:MAG: rhodanese-like domain-containing protein [Thermodesulfobacteriota bacterium]